MNKIFISYCHKDEDWKDRLVTQLGVLQMQGLLEIWEDRQIAGGEDWLPAIESALNTSNIAVLLISADFLASPFILSKDVPRLLERRQNEGVRVIPLIVKPCAWQRVAWLKPIQARPKDGRPLSGGNEHQIATDLAVLANDIASLLPRASLTASAVVTASIQSLSHEKIFTVKLPTTSSELFGREQELQRLDRAWADPHTHVLTLVAWGGVGKTALVNEWLNQLEKDNYRGAARVYGWSFYSQGTREDRQDSADEFLAHALNWFGDLDPAAGAPWDKGSRLAALIRQQKTLLVLDGVEPLQYPPGPLHGQLKDQGLQALLKELANANPGLCIVTTRVHVADLAHKTKASVQAVNLENLSPEAGGQLLRHLGVNGTAAELVAAAAEFHGHALALSLLGSYLATVHEGEVRKRDLIPHLIDQEEQPGYHAYRVMASYEHWLAATPELDLLYLMGLFDRPAAKGALDALLAPPAIAGLTANLQNLPFAKLQFVLHRLRELRLLDEKDRDRPDTLDCHPLVREHFGEKLRQQNPASWKEAHRRLYEYYKNLPAKELPDTFEEMAPLFAAVAHGCRAGLANEALHEVYWRRIQRGSEFFGRRKLGAIGVELATLASFFETPWNRLINGLNESAQSFVLNAAGFILRAFGRITESVELMKAGLDADIKRADWRNAALSANNLSSLYLSLGDIDKASNYVGHGLEMAERSGDELLKIDMHAALANVLHQKGNLLQAKKEFHSAELMQNSRHPEFGLLYSIRGFHYCELLLSLGEYKEVQKRASQTLDWVSKMNWLLDIAFDTLSLGRAFIGQALIQKSISYQTEEQEATNYVARALICFREAGVQNELPRALFTRAFLFGVQSRFVEAWADLFEAKEIAERGNMNLYLTDYHLEATRILNYELSLDDHQLNGEAKSKRGEIISQLKAHLEQAKQLVKNTGYHRRDPEVEMGYAALFIAQGDHAKATEHLTKAKQLLDRMGIRAWDFLVRELEDKL